MPFSPSMKDMLEMQAAVFIYLQQMQCQRCPPPAAPARRKYAPGVIGAQAHPVAPRSNSLEVIGFYCAPLRDLELVLFASAVVHYCQGPRTPAGRGPAFLLLGPCVVAFQTASTCSCKFSDLCSWFSLSTLLQSALHAVLTPLS